MKLKFFFLLLFSLYIVNCTLTIEALATIRYVSKTGTSTPPYTSWATAADSIQKCINICSFGDTVYVGNGIYKEQVIMIPGLSLIGAGIDSCIIDTRDLIGAWPFISLTVNDSCLIKGLKIIVTNNPMEQWGIGDFGSTGCIITQNHIVSAGIGIEINNTDTSEISNTYIYKNLIQNSRIGIDLFTSDAIVRSNIINNSDLGIETVSGISIGAYFNNYYPVIDSNIIFAKWIYGIDKSYGSSPTISNNIIILDEGSAMSLSYSDTMKIFNNLIYGYGTGIHNYSAQHLRIYNNYIAGEIGTNIFAGPNDIIENNIITNADIGIEKWYNQNPPVVRYNNLWNNDTHFSGFTTDTTNIYNYPMVVNDDSTNVELDFHLQMFSPLIDRGNPQILDRDGSRSDIGLYGGPYGENYKYQDIAPRAPINLTAIDDSNYITLNWNKNTEADTSYYRVYRDTVVNFTIDSTKLISSSSDTFYVQTNPHNVSKFVYKVSCVDKKGNESQPSEDVLVNITSVSIDDYPMIISNYQLYQNYPNPFNPTTTISYRLKERGYVKLYVYDIKGEIVTVLVNKTQEVGFYHVDFNTTHNQLPTTNNLASGIYIYQLMVRNNLNVPIFSDVKKMMYLK